MIKQRINTIIAIGVVFAAAVGASYLIIDFAQNTEFSYLSSAYIVDTEDTIETGQ